MWSWFDKWTKNLEVINGQRSGLGKDQVRQDQCPSFESALRTAPKGRDCWLLLSLRGGDKINAPRYIQQVSQPNIFKIEVNHVFPLLYSSAASCSTQNKMKTPKMAFKTLKDARCLPLQAHLTLFFPAITISQTQCSFAS